MTPTNEWKMVEELLGGFAAGEFDLHQDHEDFLEELNQNLDPYMPMIDQKSDWEITKLHWLYEWKCEGNYMSLEEFKEQQ